MMKITIKSSLAYGLAHRLKTMDGQMVVDACSDAGYDAIEAVRKNLAIVKKIMDANHVFVEAVEETEKKKRAVFAEIKEKYDKEVIGKSKEEAAKMARDLQAEFNVRAAEIQKESKADPDAMINVEVSGDEYEKVLIPVFKKTVQMWDVNGDGKGQELFLEVADALMAAQKI
jgi:hypothetical protein